MKDLITGTFMIALFIVAAFIRMSEAGEENYEIHVEQRRALLAQYQQEE